MAPHARPNLVKLSSGIEASLRIGIEQAERGEFAKMTPDETERYLETQPCRLRRDADAVAEPGRVLLVQRHHPRDCGSGSAIRDRNWITCSRPSSVSGTE